jgi:hypothetical protein
MQLKKLKNQEKTAKSLSNYGRYSSLAFQMIAIILLGVFGGIKLDAWLKMHFPVFTILLSFVAVLLALYTALKDLLNTK